MGNAEVKKEKREGRILRTKCYSSHHDEPELPVLVYQPGGEAAAGLEAGRRGGEVGREGRRRSRQEVEEDQGGHRVPGAGAELPRPAQQVCHHTPQSGRSAPGEKALRKVGGRPKLVSRSIVVSAKYIDAKSKAHNVFSPKKSDILFFFYENIFGPTLLLKCCL